MRTLGVWLASCCLCCLALCCLAQPVQALELVTNGAFEQPLTTGWQQETSGSAWYIERAVDPDPDPDYEALIRHNTGTGMARLYQRCVIPSTNVQFSVHAKMQATATSTAWSGAAVALSYFDQHGFLLGETYVGVKSQYCPWADSPTFHLISGATGVWMDYAFNLADELTNLPGIDPDAVHEIAVGLCVKVSDC